MPEVTLVEAVNLALALAMEEDPSVVVLGEDVGVSGGVFRATAGLQQRFGSERVIDTPLSETLISGLCIGMAAQGLHPVGEIQFMGFIYPCIDQLVNHASRLRNRTQGRLSCPMVLRTPFGAGIRAPEHHSESTEAMLAHIPGLRVVVPSSPERAYGLLLAAIRDPDPVVFLEPTRIYRAAKGEVEDNGEALPLDVAFITREGRDVTLISEQFDEFGVSGVSWWRDRHHVKFLRPRNISQPGDARSLARVPVHSRRYAQLLASVGLRGGVSWVRPGVGHLFSHPCSKARCAV